MDTGSPAATTCATCGAAITAEELAGGLAVRVAGHLVCPLCVDHLPGNARVHINQMRALRGLVVTTYAVPNPRHPALHLFSFTTTGQMLQHRRKLAHGEQIETPPLPPPGSRPRLPTAREAARGHRIGWIVSISAGALLAGLIGWAVVAASPNRSRPALDAASTKQSDFPQMPAADLRPVLLTAPPNRQMSFAQRLTELEHRASDPAQVRAVERDLDLWLDELPVSAESLRPRANALQERLVSHRNAVEQQPLTPAAPSPATESPAVQPPVTTTPLVAAPAPASATAPAPTVPASVTTLTPSVAPAQPAPPTELHPNKVAADKPTLAAWEPDFPTSIKPVSMSDSIPWPWPSTPSLWRAQPTKVKGVSYVLDLHLPIIAPPGGISLVLHPGHVRTKQIRAIWSGQEAINVPFSGFVWQTVAIPAPPGGAEFLRLEDTASDASPSDAFLLAKATIVHGRAPMANDVAVALPLAVPSDRSSSEAKDFRLAFREQCDRTYPKRAKLNLKKAWFLLEGIDHSRDFSAILRRKLEGWGWVSTDHNPGDLPDFDNLIDPRKNWSKLLQCERIDDIHSVIFGLDEAEWGNDAVETAKRTLRLRQRILSGSSPALPILVVGSWHDLTPTQQEALDNRWKAAIADCVKAGVPVIDIRSAQCASNVKDRHQVAAQTLVDGLIQLRWFLENNR